MSTKTYLVTGGTTGIGLATARLLAADGAKVIVTGRNPETLAAAKKEVPPTAVVLKSDSGSLADALALGAEVKKHADKLDGAFLNAGIGQFAPLELTPPELFESTFAVNVRGPYFQLQSLLPLLANPSSVVFTSSVAGTLSLPASSVYSATKAALNSIAKIAAVELAPKGIRVNYISPGPIET
ncbi:MAG TPA: SDR family NAD(P)-dependent oxidoreductase, partial [Candidatus Methylacidiphilales bacterium]